ncbi:MAG: hypothetical protein PHR45_06145 [Muribaculaceae bacterium]|nr:hypothetical protein [Muribaculaceae bacterium]
MKTSLVALAVALFAISTTKAENSTIGNIDFTRNVVIEEATGAWCGFCVSGIAGMEYMNTNYPDNFIAIAVHYSDQFANNDGYIVGINPNGFPYANVDRTVTNINPVPSIFEYYYKRRVAEQADAKITTVATFSEDKASIIINSDAIFRIAKDGKFNYSYVVLEDDVAGVQQNYYSGGRYGAMMGFENLASSVRLNFKDISRVIYPSYKGNFFAENVKELSEYSISETMKTPTSVSKKENLYLVSLLINATTGKIENAHKVKILDYSAVVSPEADNSEIVDIEYYTISGNKIQSIDDKQGVFIKKTIYGNGTSDVEKLIK